MKLGWLAIFVAGWVNNTGAADVQASDAPATKAGAAAARSKVHDQRAGSIARGANTYQIYCVLCHGPGGEGDGRAAANLSPRPANLVLSRLSDKDKAAIVRGGGQSVGRSAAMPPWGSELTNAQIRDLTSFLRSFIQAPS